MIIKKINNLNKLIVINIYLLVGFIAIHIICTELCFFNVDKECKLQPNNEISDINLRKQELICWIKKFKRCPNLCMYWLETEDCTDNKEMCAVNYVWDLISDIFKSLGRKD